MMNLQGESLPASDRAWDTAVRLEEGTARQKKIRTMKRKALALSAARAKITASEINIDGALGCGWGLEQSMK
jgi:hypothetical protein